MYLKSLDVKKLLNFRWSPGILITEVERDIVKKNFCFKIKKWLANFLPFQKETIDYGGFVQ